MSEAALVAGIFAKAIDDLRTHIECTCADVEYQTCHCTHAYRTARRFLLGTRPAWRRHRDTLCQVVGVEPDRIQRRALEVIARRKRMASWSGAESAVSGYVSCGAYRPTATPAPVGMSANG